MLFTMWKHNEVMAMPHPPSEGNVHSRDLFFLQNFKKVFFFSSTLRLELIIDQIYCLNIWPLNFFIGGWTRSPSMGVAFISREKFGILSLPPTFHILCTWLRPMVLKDPWECDITKRHKAIPWLISWIFFSMPKNYISTIIIWQWSPQNLHTFKHPQDRGLHIQTVLFAKMTQISTHWCDAPVMEYSCAQTHSRYDYRFAYHWWRERNRYDFIKYCIKFSTRIFFDTWRAGRVIIN